jgi:hypothetical protein
MVAFYVMRKKRRKGADDTVGRFQPYFSIPLRLFWGRFRVSGWDRTEFANVVASGEGNQMFDESSNLPSIPKADFPGWKLVASVKPTHRQYPREPRRNRADVRRKIRIEDVEPFLAHMHQSLAISFPVMTYPKKGLEGIGFRGSAEVLH